MLLNARRPKREGDMNAKNFSKVGLGTVTALALCGALVLSVSCAGGGGTTDNGKGGSGGSGGEGGNGEGGGGEGGGGEGGEGGGNATCSAADNEVCFASGKAEGVLQGYGYIALGKLDTATSPVCDNTGNNGGDSEPITKEQPCPDENATTKWSKEDALCISGTIPKVDTTSTTAYQDNWGIQIGMNVSAPPGETLGKTYKSVTFHFNSDGVTPTNGTSASFTAFNTECWPGGKGEDLAEEDVANIDKIGIQVSSDDKKEYTLDNFCLTKVEFAE
jgi:hypothetical protein